MITNRKLKGKSRCANCMTIKSFLDKIRSKGELEIFLAQFLID